ncbi:uncharacterized protein LOC119551967 [Drosophila subpulchrella]|uniref:uncharacterized protein LOC119551967 n=1 Tax=Drosophila subpulchrella TaxID=1486046 RepID=UPI0018A141C9|nr:uncharacterized protein LOC119551967 [Drosophila subpulchrella]
MQSYQPLHKMRMVIFSKTFLLVSLLSMICYSSAYNHWPCTIAGRCYTVNRPFGRFKQTRCVPCTMPE